MAPTWSGQCDTSPDFVNKFPVADESLLVDFKVFVPFNVIAVSGGEVGVLAHEEATDDVADVIMYSA